MEMLENTDMTPCNDSETTVDCFNEWANYPCNFDGYNATMASAPSLNTRLTRLSGQLFSGTVDIQVIGITGDGMSILLCEG